jgi:hypothetical protein
MNWTDPMKRFYLSACLVAAAAAGGLSLKAQQRPPQAAPALSTSKTAPPVKEPISLLKSNTLLTIYGRAFGVAPILGRLGQYKDTDTMAKDVEQWVTPIRKGNDNKGVIVGIHLIYALAIPCEPKSADCLLYFEAMDKEIVKNYIEPAARRGWVVILDTQLGRSTPVDQVNRMISKGYLKYDNVHVAIDPEFHVHGDKKTPGIPIGTVEASQVTEVQKILNDYVKSEGLPHRKILIVHQFGDANVHDGVPFMIENKKDLKTFENVDLVINADGFGKQPVKVVKYNKITDSKVYPFIKYRGIKIFYPNKWEKAGHFDKPPLTIPQLFGSEGIDKKSKLKVEVKPDLVIIA